MSKKFKKIVVKIGSSLIADDQMKPHASILRALVKQVSDLREKGVDVVVVSSGAIVLGMGELGERKRPTDLASLQARAAIGQNVLMRHYGDLFKKHSRKCAQVLLTWDDFDDRGRYNNARNTLNAILASGIIPIINENDTISTEEIKFGDNDRLSALVAVLVQADLLIILSDVEGLYDMRTADKKLFQEVREVTEEIEGLAQGTSNKHVARGGMKTKLDAVKMVTHASIPCVITSGRLKNVLSRISDGERLGTFFYEKEDKLLSRKHWISFGAKPKGWIVVDEGAKKALLDGGKSLLLPGVVAFDGHFKAEDVVIVCDSARQEIARGITAYSISDLHKIGKEKGKQEVIHRDNLVLCKR